MWVLKARGRSVVEETVIPLWLILTTGLRKPLSLDTDYRNAAWNCFTQERRRIVWTPADPTLQVLFSSHLSLQDERLWSEEAVMDFIYVKAPLMQTGGFGRSYAPIKASAFTSRSEVISGWCHPLCGISSSLHEENQTKTLMQEVRSKRLNKFDWFENEHFGLYLFCSYTCMNFYVLFIPVHTVLCRTEQ